MRPWRSIGFRLTAMYTLLLLAGLISLGAALWIGVNYNMVSAVDGLLLERKDLLAQFVNAEFDARWLASPDGRQEGDFKGRIEEVGSARDWVAIGGARIRLRAETEFEGQNGKFSRDGLTAGQFVDVEVRRAGAEWIARTIALEPSLEATIEERVSEYASAAADGNRIEIRNAAGRVLLAPRQDGLPWQSASGLATVDSPAGPFRVLRAGVRLGGIPHEIQMDSSLAAVSATRRGLVRWAMWALPVAIAFSLLGGALIGRAALRPLERFAALAARVDARRLSERLDVPPTRDAIQKLAETFNGMMDRLESAVRRLDEFTADASHELRSPVAVIRTTAELALRQGRGEQALRGDMTEIACEATRLTELIDGLLTLARADHGENPSPATDVDLSVLAHDVSAQFRRLAPERDIEVETQAPSPVVRGHEPSLRRLLVILVDNAVRHTPDSASIWISIAETETGVAVGVADSGPGIPVEDLDRLFDRFYRGDSSRNRAKGGAGLGLAIAKWIAESHRGRIGVTSSPGAGTAFRVDMPAVRGKG